MHMAISIADGYSTDQPDEKEFLQHAQRERENEELFTKNLLLIIAQYRSTITHHNLSLMRQNWTRLDPQETDRNRHCEGCHKEKMLCSNLFKFIRQLLASRQSSSLQMLKNHLLQTSNTSNSTIKEEFEEK